MVGRLLGRLQRLENASPKEGVDESQPKAQTPEESAWAAPQTFDVPSTSMEEPIHSIDDFPAAKTPPPPRLDDEARAALTVSAAEPPVASSDETRLEESVNDEEPFETESRVDQTGLDPAEEIQPAEGEVESARSDVEDAVPEPAPTWPEPERSREEDADLEPVGRHSVGTVEETFGSRILVWIGGVALVLAGGFLVRYSIENQVLSVQSRHWLAAMMGLGLTGAGSWMRSRAAGAATALVGAGLVICYLTVFSATALFELMAPGVGFALLILLTAGAVSLSIQHGQFAAILGCLGGFASPLLISGTIEGSELLAAPSVFFGYLLFLQIGLLGTAVIREFRWGARLTFLGTLVWCLVYWAIGPVDQTAAWSLGYLLVATALFQVYDWLISRDLTVEPDIADRPGLVSLFFSTVLVVIAIFVSGYAIHELMLLYALGSGSLVLGLLRPSLRGHGVVIAALVTLVIAGASDHYSGETFRMIVLVFGSMFVLISLTISFTRPGGSLVYPLIVCLGVPIYYLFGVEFALAGEPWGGSRLGPNGWWTAVVAAILPTILVIRFFRDSPERAGPAALTAAGMLTWAACLALVDHRAWLLVVLCLLAAGLAGITVVLGLVAWMRWAWCWLAAGVMWILIEARMSITWPELWVTAAVSLTALIAFAVLANLAKRQERSILAVGMAGIAIFAPLLGLSILVVQWFKDGPPSNIPERLGETGTQILLLLGGALVLQELTRRIVFPGLLKLSQVVAAITVVLGLVFLAVVVNPLLTKELIAGPKVFNPILIYYGSAAAMLWMMVWQWSGERSPILILSRASALIFTSVLGILLVRHGYVGEQLIGGQEVVTSEWTAYGVVVMVIALAVLEYQRRQSTEATPVDVLILVSSALAAWVGGALLLANPLWTDYAIAGPRVFNMLWWIYGTPALLFWIMVWQASGGRSPILTLSRASALLFTAVLGIMLVRHGYVGGNISEGPAIVPSEWTAYGVVLMVIAMVLFELRRRRAIDEPGHEVLIFVSAALVAWFGGALLVANPLWNEHTVAGPRVFNMLWWIYGTPAVLFWGMVWQASRSQLLIRNLSRSFALLFTANLGMMLVRHGFVGGNLYEGPPIIPSEWTAYGVVVMVIAAALLEYRRRQSGDEPAVDALIFVSLALVAWVGGALLLANPLWTAHSVAGPRVFNMLWWIYGIPLTATACVGVRYRRVIFPDWLPHVLAGASILLGFALITLLVRHFFSAPNLSLIGASLRDREWYSYSAAWLMYGLLLFGGGLFFRTAALRYGSLVVMLVAVGKVFLIDASQLDGLLRVGSFLGLGVILVLMGYVYQRFLFQKS